MTVFNTKQAFKSNPLVDKFDAEGDVYAVCDGKMVHYVACIYANEPRLAKPAELKFTEESFYKWRMIPFAEIAVICQDELVRILGEDFPFEDSFWESKKEYSAWQNPVTISEKTKRAISDEVFFKKWRTTKEWTKVKRSYPIYRKRYLSKSVCYIAGEGWFCERCLLDQNGVVNATLVPISEFDARWMIKKSNPPKKRNISKRSCKK